MDKAEADAELTRLQRAERAHHRNQDTLRYKITSAEKRIATLTALTGDIDTAIGRRQSTRGDAFTMNVDGIRYGKRHDAGERLVQLLQREAAGLDGGQRHARIRAGHLGGFEVTTATDRVLGTIQIVAALDGAPGSEIRLTAEDLASADPAGLVIRLENRLTGLEALKTRTLEEIGRLRTEAARASDDIGKPFPHADQLAAARLRVQDIGERLQEAAEPARQDEQHDVTATDTPDTAGPGPLQDGTSTVPTDRCNGIKATTVPGAATATPPGQAAGQPDAAGQADADAAGYRRREPVSVAQRNFPESNPVAVPGQREPAAALAPAAQVSRHTRPAR